MALASVLTLSADDVITNPVSRAVSYQYLNSFDEPGVTVASPIASYQYLNDLSEPGVPIISRIVSYRYFDSPLHGSLPLHDSLLVSYYYQFLGAPPLIIIPTNRTPITPEITPSVVLPGPYPWQLKTLVNGVLTTNLSLDPNRMTIVLTHGWNSSPNAWATNMATLISKNISKSLNILVWDWTEASKSTPCLSWQVDFVAAARQTPDQGFALGMALRSKLGSDYSQRLHFVGHSLGALVNGFAAIWLHNRGFAPTNTHLTIFDEAEVATDLSCPELVQAVLFNQWNPLAPKPYYYQPLPRRFAWADNYITAFGLLHPEAHNVILTNGFPTKAANLVSLRDQMVDFHSYPCAWYAETIISDISAMGHRWSFERNGFAEAPLTNTVFLQSFNTTLWNLAQTDFTSASNYLDGRLQKYRDALAYAITHRAPETIQANGTVSGERYMVSPLIGFQLFIISLLTQPTTPPPQLHPPLDPNDIHAAGGNETMGAYAWLPLPIPANAVSMSFDFRIEGDWQGDSLAAALNGTNVLLLAASQVETNVTLNSGPIDVTSYAGQTNEFFVGIIGETSTNALLTVQNVAFYTAAPPSLQAELSGSDFKISWPLTAQNFNLESTTNLESVNSWAVVANAPSIVDLLNTITNDASTGSRFYRLRKQ
jgi:pimeloyl-ACP methyl ester carboxylesterase